MAAQVMGVKLKARAQKAHPFGDERTVDQAIPGPLGRSNLLGAELADPFLMLDDFAMPSEGVETNPDRFPIGWHPHRGFAILTYLKTGVGRHGDSMGNRETFATPGLQWCETGSGIEHAEGGATPAGEVMAGFQIWVNTPSKHKMDDPSYGTEPPESIPQIEVAPDAHVRVLAGQVGEQVGPFNTKADVQMLDFELKSGASALHSIPDAYDSCIVYVYSGEGSVCGDASGRKGVFVLDASDPARRTIEFSADTDAHLHALVFTGKRLNEPIAWRGPIVMNTQKEIQSTIFELQSGRFPPVRAAWNYKKISDRPPQ